MEFPLNAERLDTAAATTSGGRSRRLIAAFSSAFLPGSGQFILGQKRKAIAFLFGFFAIFFLYWPTRLPRYYPALIMLMLGSWAVSVIAASDAFLSRNQQFGWPSRWWLLVVIPTAFLASNVNINVFFIAAGFRTYEMPTSSMAQTIFTGDHFVGDLRFYGSRSPIPGDIVMFKKDNQIFVKRVVAVEGSTIEGRGGSVFVDGRLIIEPYIQHVGGAPEELNNFGPVMIQRGKLFVMGDNRDISRDSRMADFGPIDKSAIAGRPLYVVLSVDSKRNGTSLR